MTQQVSKQRQVSQFSFEMDIDAGDERKRMTSEGGFAALAQGQAFSKRARYWTENREASSFAFSTIELESTAIQDSRDTRWTLYRRDDDSSNLSTVTEASETWTRQDMGLVADEESDEDDVYQYEGYGRRSSRTTAATTTTCHYHIPALQVEDLERHMDSLAHSLEAWSLTNLKEWRQRQISLHTATSSSSIRDEPSNSTDMESSDEDVAWRQRQKLAKSEMMKLLRKRG